MDKLIQFQVPISNVEVREDRIVIQGMASTPQIDRYSSIITAESFTNGGLKNYLENPVILLGHDDTKPIGTMTDHRANAEGLRIQAELTRNTDGVFEDIRDGRTKGFSIGFIPLKWKYQDKNGNDLSSMTQQELDALSYQDIVRVIYEIDLVEVSVVNVPANPGALFSLTKALRAFFDKMETRSAIELQKRELINDEDNPFANTVEAETKEEEKEEETKDEETQDGDQGQSEEEKEEVTKEEAEEEPEQSDIGEEEEEAVETTAPEQQEDQTPPQSDEQPEELKAELEKTKSELQETREVLDNAIELLAQMQSQINKIPVKKGYVYAPTGVAGQEDDALLKAMRDAREKANSI